MHDSTSTGKMKIMIAGGGTGGHVYPGIAVYDALRRIEGEVKVIFIGARGGVEERIFSDLDLPYRLLPVKGLRTGSFGSKLKALLLMFRAVAAAMKEINSFQPDVVLGTGGYASVAVIVAAAVLRKPRILQEQNSVPGMANRMLSRFSDLVLLSFPGSETYTSSHARKAVVGNPIRFKKPASLDKGKIFERFGLSRGIPVVLVMGGSRGARSINLSIADAVERVLEKTPAQFLVLTGERNFDEMQRRLGSNEGVKLTPYIEEMDQVYAIADIAVSRAGASSVFELAAWGIPAIFIPYPHAADDHQTGNVEPLVALEAAVLVKDEEISGEHLADAIVSLINDEERRRGMISRMTGWAITDADEAAAEKIMEFVKKNSAVSVTSNEHQKIRREPPLEGLIWNGLSR